MPNENFEDAYQVLHIFADAAHRVKLKELLAPQGDWSNAASQLYALLDPVCKTVIVEYHYKDRDFTASFARFFHRRHHDTPRRCVRLHYFAAEIRDYSLDDLLLSLPDHLVKEYLGFTVLRPLPSNHLGRSILSEKLVPSDDVPVFLTCKCTYGVNISGTAVTLRGAPWMQQDALVSACASVALWVVGYHMSHHLRSEFRAHSTAQITDLAHECSSSLGRPMPSLGLTLEQMLHSLAAMGYEPVLITPNSPRDAIQQIYYYIESGIPVILSLAYKDEKAHAVTVVGHSLDGASPFRTEEQSLPDKNGTPQRVTFCRSSDLISYFLVQDDDGGPFRKLYLQDDGREPKDGEPPVSCPAILKGNCKSREDPLVLSAILVPFPLGVLLDGETAEERAISLVASTNALAGQPLPDPTVVRTFLQLSNSYKEQWGPDQGRPVCVGKQVRKHLLSRWIWITEIADAKDWYLNRRAIGEVIQDAASYAVQIETEHLKDFLLIHMPRFMNVIFPNGAVKAVDGVVYDDYPLLKQSTDDNIMTPAPRRHPSPVVSDQDSGGSE